ncbi:MAG: DUF4159 domain-containing protein, partial [Planctomycetaceae bacterium]|nr:DUF4159 domain-containing protein [Planctomycetaceae bacterium]
GLGMILTARTSVEPGDPIGVEIETDDLILYPLVYWPITEDQPVPSAKGREQHLKVGFVYRALLGYLGLSRQGKSAMNL